jgi:Ca-activated chloride channel family protein
MTSDGEDDLDFLKGAMARATPRPDLALRAAHLRLAEENFAKLQQATQGKENGPRLMSDSPRRGVWQGVREMLQGLSGRGALTVTTALVACGFLFLTPQGQELWRNGGIGEADVPVLDEVPPPQADLRTDATEDAPEGDVAATQEAVAGDVPVVTEVPPAPEPVVEQMPRPQEEAVVDDSMVGGTVEAEAPADVMAREATPMTAAPMAEADGAMTGLVAPLPAAPVVQENFGYADAMAAPIEDTEAFANAEDNPLKVVAEEPVSTFSIDVDTASWAVVRQSLMAGVLPAPEAVRVEEMINYFPYDYPAPQAGEAPFRPTVTVFDTPWNPDTDLVHIAIQGMMPAVEDRPPLNLVFLIDTSGSMEDANKLPLLKQSFRLMLDNLRPEDQVAIVTYAGSAGLVLEPTPAAERNVILKALNDLAAGGSTNGQGGLEQAYAVAEGMMADGEVTRVLLATDGDFNVGMYDPTALTDFIAEKRETGVYLSVLGFGRGNLDDATMQALAQNGNGIAAYIDTLNEAQKVLVDQLTGALFPIAGDVKVQVEFNPAVIAEYRLIGYETRALAREDFNNDRVDAGELGAGHTVTAIYEVTPVGSPAQLVDPLRYSAEASDAPATDATEIGFLRMRWKDPGNSRSELLETLIPVGVVSPGTEARFAAAIAGMGQLLRGSDFVGDWGWDEAIALAQSARGEDPFGYRNEAVQMMRLAQSLSQ